MGPAGAPGHCLRRHMRNRIKQTTEHPTPEQADQSNTAKTAPMAILPAATAAPPSPVREAYPALPMSLDLLEGTKGRLYVDGVHVSNGRWSVRVDGLTGEDGFYLQSYDPAQKRARKWARALGMEPEELAIYWPVDGVGNKSTVAGMHRAKPGTYPLQRTAVVLDLPEEAVKVDFRGSFARLFVSTDPEHPGGVLFPDVYLLALGDPPQLWPSDVPHFYTDGHWVALAECTPAVYGDAVGHVVAAARSVLGRTKKPMANPG